ncbi:MAG TPA: hypothetical protein VI136_24550 [Verrucomicrobiae bacterium]
MSATELIAERSRGLTEWQAQAVLACMDEIIGVSGPTAKELLKLPAAIRSRLLAQQAARAETVYRGDPGIIAAEHEPPVEHD